MAEQRIRAINYNVEEIGKYMKSSKKRFEWVIGLNKKTHTIILDFSFISGKVKVVIDGRTILENEIPINTSFQYPFTLDGFALNLIQQGQSCELRINNKVFSHLYIQQKTQQQFTKEKDEFTIAPDREFINKINNKEKITLDIGTKKTKKVKNDDGEDWGAFGGLGVPPGFEPPPGFQVPVTTTTSASNITKQTIQSNVNQAAIDFFADNDDASPSDTTKPKQTPSLLEAMTSVAPQKPAQVNIQSLYSQNPTQNNQFFTQIPNTLDFGNTQGFGTISPQFQTTNVQGPQSSLNFNTNTNINNNTSNLNFGTNTIPQIGGNDFSSINFANPPSSHNFQTNTFGLNNLYATNNNVPINSQPNSLLNFNLNMNTGVNTSQPTIEQPTQTQPTNDPFSALQSIALQSNFQTTVPVQNQTQNSNMFFTQAPVTQNNAFDLL